MVAELVPYLGFLFTGSAAFEAQAGKSGMSASAIMAIAIVVMVVFDAIFIAMYAANLKHMKN